MASTSTVRNVLENATGVAAGIGKGIASGEASRQGLAAEDSDARPPAFTDVWTHTVSGLAARGEQSLPERARNLSPPALALLRSVPHGAARSGLEGTGSSIEAQAAQAWSDMFVLLGLAEAPEGTPSGVLAKVGATFDLLVSLEQIISTPFAMIPFPAFPAIRVTDIDIGLPHGHPHPPNLIPPAPMVPLPSTGPIIPIPILSGAVKTLINGMPAARCGDMGLGIWCGGYFPMYEVFLGSASVWIEGARAGRVAVDITKHCIFSSPKPSDPPMGPPVGITTTASPNVLIGGVPLPSFLNLLMGAAIKGLFSMGQRALGKVRNLAARARSRGATSGFGGDAPTVRTQLLSTDGRPVSVADYRRALGIVEDLESKGVLQIRGSQAFRSGARSNLVRIASTRTGREVLGEIGSSGKRVRMVELAEYNRAGAAHGRPASGPHCEYSDPRRAFRQADGSSGGGSDSVIRYNPGETLGSQGGSPSDVVLLHELDHAKRAAQGQNLGNQGYPPGSTLEQDWTNLEEAEAVATENAYRSERGGVPHRPTYRDPP